ncbi:sensor domain-containing diguanylate cyclase [Marinobacterium nitratireducens]|uniref:Sensor domain-containing diguanylate cyclase n=1 Tax=Marinobacterium nitratireducens TaxID=518897 RepID=A0A917ZI55_9GAMM|nr:diguanylate cyclase [Marinobacterium nitratireducens]GGO83228.1 sensor domain-containing diguanylate cyclase [Marinobacterium nitratireducens]
MRQLFLPVLGIVLVMLGGIVVTEYVARLAADRVQQAQSRESQARLSELRARLEGELNSVLYFTQGLTSLLLFRPDITGDEFNKVAENTLRGSTPIRNIALAPDNVIRYVYPLEGNEKVLGLDYRQTSGQWPAVKRAMEEGITTVAGPLELVQGGIGLISRTPIFIDSEEGRRYWGIVSTVIDVSRVLEAAGVFDENPLPSLAIRGIDGLGAEGAQFLGPVGLFDRPDILTQDVTFQHNRWQLGVEPDYSEEQVAATRVRVLAYGLLFIILVLLLQMLRIFRNYERRATRDPLTGLPNRRLLLERARQLVALGRRGRLDFCLCYLDLNGFKPVNDNYGHHAGDLVLLEIAARLRKLSRASDTVARTGGDEFVLLLPGLGTEAEAERIVDKLRSALAVPVTCESHQIAIGASMGWALFPHEADDLDTLMALADSRMYCMKAQVKAGAEPQAALQPALEQD